MVTFGDRAQEIPLGQLARSLEQKPKQAVALVAGGVEAYLPLAGLVDLEQEVARLGKALAEVDAEIRQVEAKLANEAFTSKAPAQVVQQQRDKLAAHLERRERLEARLKALQD